MLSEEARIFRDPVLANMIHSSFLLIYSYSCHYYIKSRFVDKNFIYLGSRSITEKDSRIKNSSGRDKSCIRQRRRRGSSDMMMHSISSRETILVIQVLL
jgi:hypothetical protein